MLTDATVINTGIYFYEESLIMSVIFYAALMISVVKRFVKKNKFPQDLCLELSEEHIQLKKKSNTSEFIRNQM